MGIKCTTPDSEISQYFDRKLEEFRQKVISVFKYVGEEAVRESRESHKYKDQTGNLTSSVGYCVLENGNVVSESSFDVVKDGSDGSSKGREFLHSLTSRYSDGIVLIVVAGMKYAVYVEAKNLNVLDSAEVMAENMLPKMLKQLK